MRWRMLALLSLAELLGMSLWFAAAAVAPQLSIRWGLDAARVGWLTNAVQLGFVAGTAAAAVLNLADLVPARGFFSASAALGALANAALAVTPGFGAALVSRFFCGFFLAGVYPPAMKMISTWFKDWRGLAIGTVVGALTVGKATPYLVHAIRGASVSAVTLVASGGALLAAALVALAYRDGPHEFPRRAFSWRLAGSVFRHRETRLAIAGYLGHMWELYAMWTWLPAFLAASAAARAARGLPAPVSAVTDLLAFGAIAAGGLGCVWGGWAARSAGYERVVTRSMAASGACALGVGLPVGAGPCGVGVGFLRGRRLRAVQRARDRGGAPARCGHGAHAPDLARVPAHDGHDPAGAGDCPCFQLALGVSSPGNRARARDRGDRAPRARARSLIATRNRLTRSVGGRRDGRKGGPRVVSPTPQARRTRADNRPMGPRRLRAPRVGPVAQGRRDDGSAHSSRRK